MPLKGRKVSASSGSNEQSEKELVDRIVKLLSEKQVVANGGLTVVDLQARIGADMDRVRVVVYGLHREGRLVSIPDKKAGRWHRKYYVPPKGEVPVRLRLEEIFTELGVPSFMSVRVSRSGKTFLIGEYGETPFVIVDFSSDPPIAFHDRRAGGGPDEVVYSKKKFRYMCKKGNVTRWYDHHGIPARVLS